MATKTLEENISQAISDFRSIKTKMKDKGVSIPNGTATSKYSDKIDEVYNAGAESVASDIEVETTRLTARMAGNTGESTDVRDQVYAEGVEAGKKSEYDAFWDTFQNYGKREHYSYAFGGHGWTKETFRPKYNIAPTGTGNVAMFRSHSEQEPYDLVEHLEELGVTLDFSKVTDFSDIFTWSGITHVGIIDTRSALDFSQQFIYAYKLQKIDLLILKSDGSQECHSFIGCYVLSSLTIEGVIGRNGLDLSWSPLNKASITSIVNALSANTTGLTVTLRLSAVNKAFEKSEGANDGSTSDEWATLIATKSNWTISLIDS